MRISMCISFALSIIIVSTTIHKRKSNEAIQSAAHFRFKEYDTDFTISNRISKGSNYDHDKQFRHYRDTRMTQEPFPVIALETAFVECRWPDCLKKIEMKLEVNRHGSPSAFLVLHQANIN